MKDLSIYAIPKDPPFFTCSFLRENLQSFGDYFPDGD